MYVLGITMSVSLRSFRLLLTSAVPSGMLYYVDHKEKKLKRLPFGWSYQKNSYAVVQWDFFLGLSLTLYSRTAEITTAWL